jgi:ArsR family transcriptional regulator
MRDLIKIFKALSDETRLRIMNLLIERECCVCEVTQALGISQTRASRNLSQLYEAGLLDQRHEGLWTIYFLSPDHTGEFRGLIVEAVKRAQADSDIAIADRKRLLATGRLCPALASAAKAHCS